MRSSSSAKKIAFWAPKGGVGKSTRCTEVGFALAEQGKKVVMIEFDSQKDISKRTMKNPDVLRAHNIPIVIPDV